MAKKKRSPPKKHGKRISGQATTETLVILAAVMLVAMVGISLLGGNFTKVSGAKESQSRIAWSRQTPLAIMESSADENNLTLVVVNNGQYPARITGFGSSDGNIPEAFPFIQPGEKRATSFNHWPLGPGIGHNTVSIRSFSISYEQSVGAGGESALIPGIIVSDGTTSFPCEVCSDLEISCGDCLGPGKQTSYCCTQGPAPGCIPIGWECTPCGGCDLETTHCCPEHHGTGICRPLGLGCIET